MIRFKVKFPSVAGRRLIQIIQFATDCLRRLISTHSCTPREQIPSPNESITGSERLIGTLTRYGFLDHPNRSQWADTAAQPTWKAKITTTHRSILCCHRIFRAADQYPLTPVVAAITTYALALHLPSPPNQHFVGIASISITTTLMRSQLKPKRSLTPKCL